MSLAPQELENSASKYAAEAIRLDSQGSRGMAIQSYQRAIESLVKLVQVYPEYKLNKIYIERAGAYQNRIETLRLSNKLDESSPIRPKETTPETRAAKIKKDARGDGSTNAAEPSEGALDDLV